VAGKTDGLTDRASVSDGRLHNKTGCKEKAKLSGSTVIKMPSVVGA